MNREKSLLPINGSLRGFRGFLKAWDMGRGLAQITSCIQLLIESCRLISERARCTLDVLGRTVSSDEWQTGGSTNKQVAMLHAKLWYFGIPAENYKLCLRAGGQLQIQATSFVRFRSASLYS